MRGAWLCLLFFLPASAAAAGYADLGKLEREAVDDALALRGLTIEPAPEGKTIGTVQVVNLDVFLARERVPLVWANIFHRTTREHHIRRESLLQAGDRYDQDLVEETTRNLQDPTLSSVVAVLPVKSSAPGMVDLLVITRDVWSLRFNQDYEAQQNSLLYYTASLSENNLFGWRKNLAAVFTMDQGKMYFGPNYIDPNILGTRLKLQAAFYWIWKRQIGEIAAGPREGTSSVFHLEYPLWALARRWGATADFSHFDGVYRRAGPGWRCFCVVGVRNCSLGIPAARHGAQLGRHPLISTACPHSAHQPGLRDESHAAVILGRFPLRLRDAGAHAICRGGLPSLGTHRGPLPALRTVHAPLSDLSRPQHLRFP
jgi:hypothetical protein